MSHHYGSGGIRAPSSGAAAQQDGYYQGHQQDRDPYYSSQHQQQAGVAPRQLPPQPQAQQYQAYSAHQQQPAAQQQHARTTAGTGGDAKNDWERYFSSSSDNQANLRPREQQFNQHYDTARGGASGIQVPNLVHDSYQLNSLAPASQTAAGGLRSYGSPQTQTPSYNSSLSAGNNLYRPSAATAGVGVSAGSGAGNPYQVTGGSGNVHLDRDPRDVRARLNVQQAVPGNNAQSYSARDSSNQLQTPSYNVGRERGDNLYDPHAEYYHASSASQPQQQSAPSRFGSGLNPAGPHNDQFHASGARANDHYHASSNLNTQIGQRGAAPSTYAPLSSHQYAPNNSIADTYGGPATAYGGHPGQQLSTSASVSKYGSQGPVPSYQNTTANNAGNAYQSERYDPYNAVSSVDSHAMHATTGAYRNDQRVAGGNVPPVAHPYAQPSTNPAPAASSKWGVGSILPQVRPIVESTASTTRDAGSVGHQQWQNRTAGSDGGHPTHYQPAVQSVAPHTTMESSRAGGAGFTPKAYSQFGPPVGTTGENAQGKSSRWGANPLDSQLAMMAAAPSKVSSTVGRAGNPVNKSVVTSSPPGAVAGRGGRAGQRSTYGRDRSRSRSPPIRRRSRSRSNSRHRLKRSATGATRSPPRSKSSSTSGPPTTRKLDIAGMTITQLSKEYQCPEIGKFSQMLSVQDLYARFPNLYIPADFVRLDMDWQSALEGSILSDISQTAASLFESNPAPLSYDSADPRSRAILEAPKFTYLTPEYPLFHTPNVSMINGFANSPNPALSLQARAALEKFIKPVKFNARVVITLGFRDSETEKVDHTMLRKLRILCGRRKGSIMLLGGPWCRELDGGDPLMDRNCLLNTARRAILSQTLLDIGDTSMCSMTKICELTYHRPQEEIKGRVYPEQDEITAIFLCKLSTKAGIPEDIFEERWQHFKSRVSGEFAGPFFNGDDWSPAVEGSHDQEVPNVPAEVEDSTNDSHVDATVDFKAEANNDLAEDVSAEEQNAITAEHEDLVVDGSGQSETKAGEIAAADNSGDSDEVEDKQAEHLPLPAVDEGQSAEESKTLTPGEEGQVVDQKVEKEKPLPVGAVNVLRTKPTTPCVFLCTQPLPKDVNNDSVKKNEAVSLRILPMHSILSYNQDDSNERIFEASIAAEVLKSSLIVSYANVVADFLLARHHQLSYLADPRVFLAVQKLTEKRTSTFNAPVKEAAPAESKEAEINTSVDAQVASVSAEESIDVITGEADDSTEPIASKRMKLSEGDVTDENTHTEVVRAESAEIAVESHATDATTVSISEEEAKHWQQVFIGACRWFDLKQDRVLKSDHLQLILSVAMRDIGKSDLANLVWDACGKEEKLRYETFV